MSPVAPPLGASATLSGVSGLLGIPSGYVNIVDFNGSLTQLPVPTGPDRVGVQHLTIKHDLRSRYSSPDACSNVNASLPQLRERYGENAVSYFNETCSGLRHIPVSVFYPACNNSQESEFKTAPVFTQSLLETITAQVLGDHDLMHNMDSQAFLDASICPDKYPMIILSPPVGGQRQAYTQLASDIASHHHVVVTVDHAFQSGAIESENGNVLFNLAGELLKPREANSGRVVDLMSVALHFNDSANRASLLWTPGTEVDLLNTFVFGHGQGGGIARMMVASNLVSGGGTLDHLIKMPAPYNQINVLYRSRHGNNSTTKPKPQPGDRYDIGNRLSGIAGEVGDILRDRLKDLAQALRGRLMNSLSTFICRVLGTCGTLAKKRQLMEASYDDGHWHDHDDKPCDDLCFYHCKLECKPDVPHGLFPDDLGKSSGKTRPDDGDWSDDWTDYQDSIGDYKGFPGRNPYRQHELSCYDDDYCYKKCCTKKHHHEEDSEWDDDYRKHRYHYDPDEDWDWQDEEQFSDQLGNEPVPSSGPHGASSSSGFGLGAEDPSEQSDGLPEKDSPENDSAIDEELSGEEGGSAEDNDDTEDEL